MDKFTKQVLDRTVKDLTHNCQIDANKGSVLCSDKYGSKIWLNENGTYSTLLVLGKFEADRGKFAQNDYRKLVENLDILDRSGQIRELFDRLQTLSDKHF